MKNVSVYKPARRNRKSDPWLIAYGPRDNRKVIRGSTDKQITMELATKLARTIERVKLGLADASELRFDEMALIPLTDHLTAFCEYLKSKQNSEKHIEQYKGYLTEIFNRCGSITIREVISTRIQKIVSEIKHSNATKNRYIAAFHGFMNWGVTDKRWPGSTADAMRLSRYAGGDKRARRVLSIEDIANLVESASNGSKAEGLDGLTRALIYKLTIASGLRANEIRTLIKSDIRSTGIYVRAANAKNKKGTLVQLPSELIKELSDHASAIDSSAKLFNVNENLSRMIRHDLSAAGIEYQTDDGVFDFHALRHQCGSLLIAAGVDVKTVQKHMRHASAKMTVDVYGHMLDEGMARSKKTITNIVQRLAQRKPVRNSPTESNKGDEMSNETSENQWSDGESNPDLLNAIQSTYRGISLKHGKIHTHRRGQLAHGAAQSALKTFFRRAVRKSK
jgi:integrase